MVVNCYITQRLKVKERLTTLTGYARAERVNGLVGLVLLVLLGWIDKQRTNGPVATFTYYDLKCQ